MVKSRRLCIWIPVSHFLGVKIVVLNFSFNHWVMNVKRMVGRNKKQEGILIVPQSVHPERHLQLLTKAFFFFFPFLRTSVRENKFCFHGQLHETYLQSESSFVHISTRVKNPRFLLDSHFTYLPWYFERAQALDSNSTNLCAASN